MIAAATGCVPRPERDRDGESAKIRIEPVTPRAAEGPALEYTVRITEPHTHYADIQVVVPTGGNDHVDLMMAVWTPGSYLVREFSRNVDSLTAATTDGKPLAVSKLRKNRWRIEAAGADRVVARYRLYARELSVRTSFISDELAILNGGSTFVTLVGGHDRAHDILLELPPAFPRSVTSLPAHPDGVAHHYLAPSFDIVVDSPIVAGSPAVHEIAIEGVPHVLANFGESGVWDSVRSARDVETIAREQTSFWRVIPYQRYVFLNILTEGGGGLEHLASTLVIASPWATRKRDDYRRWLSLISHELFHTWNVKRLRPVELGPFDYETEAYTPSLWIAEGLTSYFGDLLLVRSGLTDRKEYLQSLSSDIEELQTSPGREVQSLSMSSYDSWIKYYRGNENSHNTTISYYTKGSVVGFLIDAEIRRATRGRKSLDDVMRLAYERFSGERGYTPGDFQSVAEEVAGISLAPLWSTAVDGTGELDYQPALDLFGLQFSPTTDQPEPGEADAGPAGNGGTSDDDEPGGFLGATVQEQRGRNIVTRVERGTPAHVAGINVDDELIAIADWRVPPGDLAGRLARHRPDEKVEILISRRGQLRRLEATLAAEPKTRWKIEIVSSPSASQRAQLDRWLGRREPDRRPTTTPVSAPDR